MDDLTAVILNARSGDLEAFEALVKRFQHMAFVTTVKKRLHDSRQRLKERMIGMVSDTLKQAAPDERFSKKVIRELLARPRPLEIEGHPVRQAWEAIRAAFPDYEVVPGEEVEDRAAFDAVHEDMTRAYQLNDRQAQRTQTTMTALKALRGRTPPVRLLTPGRVFRPDAEDARHLKVFHQLDCVRIEEGVGVATLKADCERAIAAVLGETDWRWADYDFGFVDHGMELAIRHGDDWVDVTGCGMLKPETMHDAGFDPEEVAGCAFGLGLERLAAIKFGMDDLRELWRAPYVPG